MSYGKVLAYRVAIGTNVYVLFYSVFTVSCITMYFLNIGSFCKSKFSFLPIFFQTNELRCKFSRRTCHMCKLTNAFSLTIFEFGYWKILARNLRNAFSPQFRLLFYMALLLSMPLLTLTSQHYVQCSLNGFPILNFGLAGRNMEEHN